MGQKSSKKVFKRTPGYSIQEGGADPELQYALKLSSKESEKKGGLFKKEKARVIDDMTRMNAAEAAEARMGKLKNQKKSLAEKRTEKIEKMVQFATEKAKREQEKINNLTASIKKTNSELKNMLECPFSCDKKFTTMSELETHIHSSHPEIDVDGIILTEEDTGIEIDIKKYPDVNQSSIEAFQDSLIFLQKNNSNELLSQAMKAVTLILSNMITAETEGDKQKYFKIRSKVPYVQKTILSVNGAKQLLFAVGFESKTLVSEKSGEEEEYYVYPETRSINYVKLSVEYLQQAFK